MVKLSLLLLPIRAVATAAVAQAPQAAAPAPAWTPAQTQELLDRTQTIRLAPDVSHLGAGERAAVAKLIEVGRIFQDVYEDQRHHQAEAAEARLRAGSPEAKLYRLFQGPIATTLDNRRVPFLRVAEPPPGRNVYPLDLTKEEYDAFIAANRPARGS
jgi:pyruvate/2-oxoglutarate dehydrogenase complex dihydrolipoamide acyltransferase (E2) component